MINKWIARSHKVLLAGCLSLFFWSVDQAFAIDMQCNSDQTTCFLKNKRLVPGDFIGVFDSKKRLVAVGEVTKLRGVKRVVTFKKKYGLILKKHSYRLIDDEKALSPEKHFKIYEGPKEAALGFEGGLVSLGVGKGISGFLLDAHLDIHWKKNWYLVGRGYFVYASGDAALDSGEQTSVGVTVNYVGGLVGLGFLLETFEDLYIRGETSLGVVYVTATTENGLAIEDVLDNRIFAGSGLSARVSGSIVYNLSDSSFNPIITASALKVQNSTNTTISIGLRRDL